jgi:hypothetical protein
MSLEMNNIKPCFWGKKYWGTLFSMAAVYPNNPDQEYIKSVRAFLLSWRKTLPCSGCRESYTIFTTQTDTNVMNDNFFTSRNNFIAFVHRLRNKVNKKIGLEYNITKEYFKIKLDKMCCTDGNEVDGYINELSEAPFIQESIRELINNYVYKNKSHINDYNPKYTSVLIEKNLNFIKKPNFNTGNKNFKLWVKRNIKCREIINKIYNNMSCGDYGMLESFFKDKSLHLQLFYMGCSIIPLEDLRHIFKLKIENSSK